MRSSEGKETDRTEDKTAIEKRTKGARGISLVSDDRILRLYFAAMGGISLRISSTTMDNEALHKREKRQTEVLGAFLRFPTAGQR
jgi:hypothetical protein